jgi:hypothetical protein
MASRENSASTRGGAAAANAGGPAYQVFASTVVLVCGYGKEEADAVAGALAEAGGIVQTRFSAATTPHVVVSCSVNAVPFRVRAWGLLSCARDRGVGAGSSGASV